MPTHKEENLTMNNPFFRSLLGTGEPHLLISSAFCVIIFGEGLYVLATKSNWLLSISSLLLAAFLGCDLIMILW